ncbi:MAG: methylated-DNA--[protein]-cysteine S-methyltransferase [Chloroflexi bacterium]|nr:methylated-DNA--[protein]-cysteine S-methyltransferase [Chloroflexota bacterium]
MIPEAIGKHDSHLAAQVCNYLRSAQPESISLAQLGERFHLSPGHLQRIVKRATGFTPREYAAKLRLEAFKTEVRDGRRITDAIYAAGYSSTSRLYEHSDRQLGMTPTAYRERGAGLTIFYSVLPCPLGWLLVGATDRGICKLSLGDESAVLIADFEEEFANAERLCDDEGLGLWTTQVIAWLNGWQPALDLPLDLRATAFQHRVWAALQAIPVGETRSYSDIAAAIGQPKATRAVAQACARNPVALVIPCHRVLRKDGKLGGYRWGIERKQQLLESEARHKNDLS